VTDEMDSPVLCMYCSRNQCADGWRVCAACDKQNTKRRLRARASYVRRQNQRMKGDKASSGLLSAESDEQIGLWSTCVRALEEAP
jgi:hypothetical protein